MKLTIYGSGCSKCKLLTEHAEAAAKELGINYEIDKVTDMNAIIDAGVFRTPALAVNGDLVIEGAVPSADKLKTYLA
ncbi:MAG: MTH895/ArsE family thioredoxin-like protein [Gammaproteobacteria bacterium]|nr:MTH895/ArsE family thioredoxin-like protein [Gammaproteobacteria bacterium]